MNYAKVFHWDGELIAEDYYIGGKHFTEKYPEQDVEIGHPLDPITYEHKEGEQYFQEFDENDNLLYDSRTHEEHEWFEYETCHFHYEGCTIDSTTVWNSDQGRIGSHNYPCCKNCYEKREAEQEQINERYLNIKPFTGMNDAGEYYDEDSY